MFSDEAVYLLLVPWRPEKKFQRLQRLQRFFPCAGCRRTGRNLGRYNGYNERQLIREPKR